MIGFCSRSAAKSSDRRFPAIGTFQASPSWEKPTTKHESMILSTMVLPKQGCVVNSA